jgi:hypothetical protein
MKIKKLLQAKKPPKQKDKWKWKIKKRIINLLYMID